MGMTNNNRTRRTGLAGIAAHVANAPRVGHNPKSYESTCTCTVCGAPVAEHNDAERAACVITAEHVADALAEHAQVYRRPMAADLIGRGVR